MDFVYQTSSLLYIFLKIVYFTKPRFTFKAKFYFPGSLSFCTEGLCLDLGIHVGNRGVYLPRWYLPAHSGPISRYSRLKTGSFCLSCEKMAAWSGQLLGIRVPCIPNGPTVLGSYWPKEGWQLSRKPNMCQELSLIFHFSLDYSGIGQSTSDSVSLCFTFPSLKFWVSAIQQHVKSCLKCFESCFMVLLFQTLVLCSLIRITDIYTVIHTYFPIQSLEDAPRIWLDNNNCLHFMD